MKVIAHISDLHFGAEEAMVATGLLRDLEQLRPSLIVISGDLTQRARSKQFQAAQKYITQLPGPSLSVPGNHDVPFYDVLRRFLAPLKRYCRFINHELNPWFEDSDIALLGLNTARALTWKSGRISLEQIQLIRTRFATASTSSFKIIVTHHPFIPPPGDTQSGIDLVGRAALALPVIDECCVDLLLAGHLHEGYTGDVRTYYPATSRSIVVAQAGTAISHRTRGQPNGYNLLFLNKEQMGIAVRAWNGSGFAEATRVHYDLVGQEWKHRT